MYERAVQTGMEDAQRTVQLDPDSGAAVFWLTRSVPRSCILHELITMHRWYLCWLWL